MMTASDDTLGRLMDLYNHTDPALARALEERVGLAAIVGAAAPKDTRRKPAHNNAARVRNFFARSAGTAGKVLARANGPRIGAIAFDGWDTHAGEGAANGRLATLLGALDDAIAAVEVGMGPAWRETVVAVVIEFGRTARINGTLGTDHGTATTAFLAGGALKGGRVLADWPGLAEKELYEGRDLMPTSDLRSVLKGLLQDHLGVPVEALATAVFPGSSNIKPMAGLVA
jgi:uncharacterized protein (DUF1501 family)